MKRHLVYIGVALIAAALLTACRHGHGHGAEEHPEEESHAHSTDDIHLSPAQIKELGVETEAVRPGSFSETFEVSGRVLPAQGAEATVAATMSGIVRLAKADMAEGAAVAAGQQLFVIDGSPMADGNPAAAAQAEREAAGKALQRAERLAAERIISARDLEEARQRSQTAEAAARSLGNAGRRRAVSSPLGGFVKSVSVKAGDYVEAGQAMAVVSQTRRLRLRAEVPEREYAALPRVSSANFRMSYDAPGVCHSLSALSGRLVSRGTAADEAGGFVPVTFEFDNRGGIVPGAFAEVHLLGEEREGVISVPLAALTEAQGLHFVYVQTGGGTFRRREVTVGGSDGFRTEVTDGLKAGERVVVKGAALVRLAANASVAPEGHSH